MPTTLITLGDVGLSIGGLSVVLSRSTQNFVDEAGGYVRGPNPQLLGTTTYSATRTPVTRAQPGSWANRLNLFSFQLLLTVEQLATIRRMVGKQQSRLNGDEGGVPWVLIQDNRELYEEEGSSDADRTRDIASGGSVTVDGDYIRYPARFYAEFLRVGELWRTQESFWPCADGQRHRVNVFMQETEVIPKV